MKKKQLNKLKILLINERHYNSGGAEKQFFALKKLLQKRGITVHSLGFGPKYALGRDYYVLKESRYALIREFYRNILNPTKFFRMRRYIKNFNPDVIHLHNINNYTPTIIRAVNNHKIILTLHDYSMFCPEGWNTHNDNKICKTGFRKKCWLKHKKSSWPIFLSRILTYFIKKRFFKTKVNIFITPTPMLKEYVKNSGYTNTEYIPNILNYYKLTNNIKNISANTRQNILYVGSLEYNKGVTILLEEYYLAKQKFEKYFDKKLPRLVFPKLMIVGKGSLESQLKSFVKLKELENDVVFIGWSDNTKKYYNSAMFVVVPSLFMEQFGMVAAEAMMNSVAVVGANIGGISWLVKDKHTGLLFNPNTRGELSDVMIKIINNKSLTYKMGVRGYKRIKQLINNTDSINKILREYQYVK